jgi:hypothetical protein
LSALLNVDGASTPRAIRTFDGMVEVGVAWPRRMSFFVQGNWRWSWAVLLAPLVGWGWNKRLGIKGDESED